MGGVRGAGHGRAADCGRGGSVGGLGGWGAGQGVGVKLDMKKLCQYLSTAKHASKVALIKECRQVPTPPRPPAPPPPARRAGPLAAGRRGLQVGGDVA